MWAGARLTRCSQEFSGEKKKKPSHWALGMWCIWCAATDWYFESAASKDEKKLISGCFWSKLMDFIVILMHVKILCSCWRMCRTLQQSVRQTVGKRCLQFREVQQCRLGLRGFVRHNLPLWHMLLWEGDADWTPVLSLGLPAVISLGTPNWSLVYLWYLYGPLMGSFSLRGGWEEQIIGPEVLHRLGLTATLNLQFTGRSHTYSL